MRYTLSITVREMSMNWGNLFFSAYGRIGRSNFWLAWAMLLFGGLLVMVVPGVNLIAWAVLIYCGICIRSKRLHDMGRSGWWQVAPVAAYLAVTAMAVIYGLIVAAAAIGAETSISAGGAAPFITIVGVGGVAIALAAMAAWMFEIGFLLWIGISEPDPFDNPYGPAPDLPEPPATATPVNAG